ncbi:MAG: GNAT family N-acetyltransferase [Actinobacteria bacterium]|nr:GNAT family N-acetyltransferase [Actinomycetota bacterium]
MNLNFTIKDLTCEKVDSISLKCLNCTFWTDANNLNLLDDVNTGVTLWELLRNKFFELKSSRNKKKFLYFFSANGGTVKAAFSSKKCIGILVAGRYYLFPKLKLFSFYPPDTDSIFLGCLFVLPEYRNLGVGKRLLISLEKDLIKNKVGAIETVGKRLNDDMDIEDYVSSPIIPVKFLIKNGFYIKQNARTYPLLRLDLSAISIAKEFLQARFALKNIALKRAIKTPVNFREE